ncbi:acyl-CoA carboxylase epsilon subunit [Streptomyces sp. AC512_CC834]|uniref:acyl-CoA carboxylase epsilon subunit n=1 Tax=Streptomyces sp. AC512_CC834 TaxID=2823691 RepID=UPI001C25D965|nr:acyl-CoA carboxylase epsilon subunit [Streptomyces sp. AC512_CC834]
MTTAAQAPPLVRVVRGGDIADEELAALTAVLLSRATATPPHPDTTPDPAPDIAPRETSVVPLWDRPAAGMPYRSPLSWRG